MNLYHEDTACIWTVAWPANPPARVGELSALIPLLQHSSEQFTPLLLLASERGHLESLDLQITDVSQLETT